MRRGEELVEEGGVKGSRAGRGQGRGWRRGGKRRERGVVCCDGVG